MKIASSSSSRSGWALALTLATCLVTAASGNAQTPPPPRVALANPASQNCVAKGGSLSIEKNGKGGQFGVCMFPDNLQCEEWAMFRGECPEGGLRVTGYITPAARYCAITGGRYAMVVNSDMVDERGNCTLPSGKVCDAAAHYLGHCGP